jgi:hypothetical protein
MITFWAQNPHRLMHKHREDIYDTITTFDIPYFNSEHVKREKSANNNHGLGTTSLEKTIMEASVSLCHTHSSIYVNYLDSYTADITSTYAH